jgi:hypothetical protein
VPAGLAVPLPPGTPAGPLGTVLERSRQLCLNSYNMEVLSDSSAGEVLQRWKVAGLSPQQSAVFTELYRWRDRWVERGASRLALGLYAAACSGVVEEWWRSGGGRHMLP